MEADVEFEADAIGHEMYNQQSEKPSFPNITQSWIPLGMLGAYLQLLDFTFFCILQSLFRTILGNGSW